MRDIMRRFVRYNGDVKRGKEVVVTRVFTVRSTMMRQVESEKEFDPRNAKPPMSKAMIFKRDRDGVMADAKELKSPGPVVLNYWAYGDKKFRVPERMSRIILPYPKGD